MGDADKTVIVPPLTSPTPNGVSEVGFTDGDEWDETLAQINLNFRTEEVQQPSRAAGYSYNYKNVPIQFPYPAYPSQRQMMEKIIEGVTSGENCLLESPTGTGKTAALLCSLLGWQRDCYNRNDNCSSVIAASVERMGGCTCGLIKDKERTTVVLTMKKNEPFLRATTYPTESEYEKPKTPPLPESESKSNELSPVKTPKKPPSSASSSPRTPMAVKHCPSPISTEHAPSPSKRQNQCEVEEKHIEKACKSCIRKYVVDKSRPPRIFYCTRTHSQIAQVVKQLKATAYKNTSMTILAGREPTCINENVLKFMNLEQSVAAQAQTEETNREPLLTINDYCSTLKKNYYRKKKMLAEMCSEDIEDIFEESENKSGLPEVCKYFRTKEELATEFAYFQGKGAWDLADIKKEGEGCKRCPFFGCHALQDGADIVFGSYNYLLQPDIRKAKEVKYINSVLVFDEAHNIEDICRNAFSFSIEVDKFDKNIRELVDSLIQKGQNLNPTFNYVSLSTIQNLNKVSVTFKHWSDKIKEWGNAEVARRGMATDRVKINDINKPYESKELMNVLVDIDMTAESVTRCLQLLGCEKDEDQATTKNGGGEDVSEEEFYTDSRGNKRPFKVSSKVGEFLRKIRQTLKYLCGEEVDGIGGSKDFKGYLTGVANPSRKEQNGVADDGRRARMEAKPQQQGPEFFFKFEIICLNPAVGFRHLRDTAYSIIVASGTLTPLNSFASELATKFKVTLQANHVIPVENVWAGVISSGPSNTKLHLNKAHQDDTAIQDDVGRIIRDICYTVPNGVLVFFPSYSLMRKLDERWRSYPQGNSIYNQIQKRKALFFEESKDKKAFQLNMERYKEYVKGGTSWDGCLLLAVFRGKISEGIDFADEQARAVVTIGIPYSNAGAAEIVSKRSYNDLRKKKMKIGETFLSGHEWYTTNAYRAMNQAFGRCVRHCDDWGALILIDSRLTSKSHDRYISSWVRKSLTSYPKFTQVKSKLEKFIQDMKTKRKAYKEPIQIEYENDELDCTELVECGDASMMSTQEDQFLTQFANIHDMTTQQIPNMTSTPIPEREILEISTVAESSPEYSFTEDVNEVLGRSPPPPSSHIATTGGGSTTGNNPDQDQSESSDSISVYGKTPSQSGNESDNDSDREMFDIADRLQDSVNQQLSQGQRERDEQNQSDIFDVSMPSVYEGNSEQEMSQTSSVSYHSE